MTDEGGRSLWLLVSSYRFLGLLGGHRCSGLRVRLVFQDLQFEHSGCCQMKANYCIWFAAKETETCSMSRLENRPGPHAKEFCGLRHRLPKEVLRVTLVMCDSQGKRFLAACGQVRNTE